MTETLANGYSSESTQWELSNEYQHDRVLMIFKNLCTLGKSSLSIGGVNHSYARAPASQRLQKIVLGYNNICLCKFVARMAPRKVKIEDHT